MFGRTWQQNLLDQDVFLREKILKCWLNFFQGLKTIQVSTFLNKFGFWQLPIPSNNLSSSLP